MNFHILKSPRCCECRDGQVTIQECIDDGMPDSHACMEDLGSTCQMHISPTDPITARSSTQSMITLLKQTTDHPQKKSHDSEYKMQSITPGLLATYSHIQTQIILTIINLF